MNHTKVVWQNQNAPVEAVPVKRRRRSKLMFQEERQELYTEEEQAAEADYHRCLAEQRKVK